VGYRDKDTFLQQVNREVWFNTVEENRVQALQGVRTRQATYGQSVPDPPGLELRKFFYYQRVVGPWNNLPESIRRAETVKSFKNSYDEWIGGRDDTVL
jgi:hypothetical protein